MADMQTLFRQVDQLEADEIKQLYEYIVRNHVEFTPKKSSVAALKPREWGLHAHLGPHWASEDFDNELPPSFWLGDE